MTRIFQKSIWINPIFHYILFLLFIGTVNRCFEEIKKYFSQKTRDGSQERFHDAGAEEEVADVAEEEGRGGVEEGAGEKSSWKKSHHPCQMRNKRRCGKINIVKYFGPTK